MAAIDRPSADEPIREQAAQVAGWALPFGRERIRRVELLVDGQPAGAARLTLRPDIAESYGLPEAILSGFEATVELERATRGAEIALSLEVHGLGGSVWGSPAWRLALAPAEPAPEAGDTRDKPRESGDRDNVPWPRTALLDGPGRDWTRRRLGYDPSHVVVLVADATLSAGPAIAALDVLAERWPSLELLIPEVRSDSYIANLMQRATRATGLEDRVTVPFVPPPADGWPVVADLVLTTSMPGATDDDLAASIDALEAACAAAR